MSWSTPWLFGAIALVLPWLFWRRRQLLGEAMRFPPLQLPRVAARASRGWRWLLVLEAAVLVLATVALAGPQRIDETTVYQEQGVDLALVLDISASMQAADFPPSRLEVLKRLAVEMTRRSAGNRIGVYSFAGFSATQTPFTTDRTALAELIDGLAYESIDHSTGGGTAVGDALLLATADLAAIRVAGRDQAVVLVTDGESNQGADPALAARYLGQQGVRLYVIGIGQDRPVPVSVNGKPFIASGGKRLYTRLDDTQLRQIATLAGGTYFRADSADLLRRIFDDIARLQQKPLAVSRVRVARSQAPRVALGLALLLALWLAADGLVLRRPLR